jgi:transcriptional regulator with XRE-family HTH domain
VIPTSATSAVLTTVKRLLRERGRTYAEVALHLGVSLPTVKRLLNSPRISLDTLARIADLVGMTTFELVREAEDSATLVTYFDAAQDALFAKDPPLADYFTALAGGMTPADIEAKHGPAKASTAKYLAALERAGLIVTRDRKVHIRIPQPFGFARGSAFLKSRLRDMICAVADGILAKFDQPGRDLIVVRPLRLTATRYRALRNELSELVLRYMHEEVLDRRAGADATEDVVVVVMCDDYRPAPVTIPDR